MIPKATIETINGVRETFLDGVHAAREVPSFATLCSTSSDLAAEFERIAAVGTRRHVRDACTGGMTCAVIGSSGHGKTTILDEMFPALAERGWLETDVTDTTSQALRVSYADRGDPGADAVTVTSWSNEQIKHLMSHDDVSGQNDKDNIEVTYLEDTVLVDGTETTLDPRDLAEWRYPRRIELQPFAAPYVVTGAQSRDRKFIRALTVKEQSAVLDTGAVLEHGGRTYNGLELRALVESVSLRDDFERIRGWAGQRSGSSDGGSSGNTGSSEANDVEQLTFVDTPGLAVSSVVKDEVLRHFLGKKSNQIALELLRNDELDIVIHLVLCGQKSQFDALWNEIEHECGRAEMEGIAERLILAINGMNIYFTNPDIRAKYTDAATTAREGDHFAATLEDNILQRMSPRGHIRPARIVFLDSANIVGAFGDYGEFYARHKPSMEQWAEPGGVGHETLARLGCVESFRDNIDALANPDDRGQGFLVRALLDLIEAKGSAILVRKHLVRTGLLKSIDALHDLVTRFYDTHGNLNTAAADEALAQCLGFLDRRDLPGIERFATAELDPYVEGLVAGDDEDATEEWVGQAFERMCELVKEAIIDANQSKLPAAIWNEFGRLFDERSKAWCTRWGYSDNDLPPPESTVGTRDLVVHCLKLHGREILYQLLTCETGGDASRSFAQTETDRAAVDALLRSLEQAKAAGAAACTMHGVDA